MDENKKELKELEQEVQIWYNKALLASYKRDIALYEREQGDHEWQFSLQKDRDKV